MTLCVLEEALRKDVALQCHVPKQKVSLEEQIIFIGCRGVWVTSQPGTGRGGFAEPSALQPALGAAG